MLVVRWIKGHQVAVALLTLLVASVGAEPAAASSARRGAWYRASGRQPHFPAGAFGLEFRVTADGRRVTLLNLSAIVSVACAPAPRSLGLAPATGSARIRHDGTFRADPRATGVAEAAGTTVTVTGRFLSHGRARGTLRYRGQGQYTGCNANGIWTAHAWPPLPSVQHVRGTTTQGSRVTFDRTIESHRRVLRFKFGSLRATNSDPGCTSVPPTASPAFGPPWDVFTLPVKHRRFGHIHGRG